MSKRTALDYCNNQSGPVNLILNKVRWLQKLNVILAQYLAPEMMDYCKIAGLKGDLLIISVTNSGVASHLRFLTPMLIQQLKSHNEFVRLTNISYLIDPLLAQVGAKI